MTEAPGRTVLVVGGAGYVGNVLVRRLLEAGYGVRVLDRLIFEHGDAIAPLLERDGFELMHADLRDPGAIDKAFAGVTDVALLAGLVGDPITKVYPRHSEAINVDGCKALIGALPGRGIDRFVFTSTCSNYGLRVTDEMATEDSELAPVSLYARQKVEIEELTLSEAADYTPTVLRIATAYGLSPRMRFDLTIAEFTAAMAAGEELVVYDPDTWRPYCHVEDISSAIITALEAPAGAVRSRVFNTGHSDENYTKRMVVDIIQDRLGGAGRVRFLEGGVDPRNYRVSFDRIATELGFAPEHRVPTFVDSLVTAVQIGAYSDRVARKGFFTNLEIGARYLAESGITEDSG